MLNEDIKKITSTERDCRNFGLVVGGVLAALGGYGLWRKGGGTVFTVLLLVGAALMALGLVVPRILRPLQKLWMTLAVFLGFIMTHVILTIFFFLVVTPLAMVARLFGSKFLDVKWKDGRASYWEMREEEQKVKSDYEKQY